MYRELRIAILIVLIAFIYGLMTYFSSGGFVTPFFFSKLILIGASVLFFFLNVKEKGSVYLIFAIVAMVCYAIGDEATINLITKGGQRLELYNLLNNQVVITASFILFFAFYYAVLLPLARALDQKWIIGVFALLLSGSIGLIIFQQYLSFQIVFSLFLGIYFVLVFRKNLPEKSVLNAISALFLLQLSLELFKYLL